MVVSNFIAIDEAYSFQLPEKVKLKETAILYKTKKTQNKKMDSKYSSVTQKIYMFLLQCRGSQI